MVMPRRKLQCIAESAQCARTHQSPPGNFQVHFYRNRVTRVVDYKYDEKLPFNGAR